MREIGIIYNISHMTNVNEIERDTHMRMEYSEFVEAIARVADKVISRNAAEALITR